jgi:hypothetical protein
MTQPIIHDEKRAVGIAEIRQLADLLDRNPQIPLPYQVDALGFINHQGDADPAAGLATLRDLADSVGGEVDERLADRTTLTHTFGKVKYRLVTWHMQGRPGQLDERDAELAALRAKVAELEAARSAPLDQDAEDAAAFDRGFMAEHRRVAAENGYGVARCGDLAVHGPHVVDHGPDQPRNCPGVRVPTEQVAR